MTSSGSPPADVAEARARAQAALDQLGPDLVLLDRTIERDELWVFFGTTRRHAETGNLRDAVPGLGAIAVERATGTVTFLSTSASPELAIEEMVRRVRRT